MTLSAKSYLFLIAGLLVLLQMFACGKREENLPPSIIIEKPYEMQQVSPGDTLLVEASISDDKLISKVLVQLVDGEGVPCGPAQETVVGMAGYSLSTSYVIPPDLGFGTSFRILIRAYDETEYKNKYREIIMLFPPLERMGILVVTQESQQMKEVFLVDSLMAPHSLLKAPGDSGATLLWDLKQMLVISGEVSGDLLVYNLRDTSLAWSVPAVPNPPFACFTGLCTDGDLLWTGFEEGYVSGYTHSGVKTVQTPPSASYIPRFFTRTGDVLVGYWDDRLGPGGRIYWHYTISGAMKHFASFPDQACSIVADDDASFFVYGNRNGEATIWDESAGVLSILHTFSTHEMLGGTRMATGDFILALDDGIYMADAVSGGLTAVMPGISATLLCYDELSGTVIAASGNQVIGRNLAGGPLLTANLPYPVTGIHAWYSR